MGGIALPAHAHLPGLTARHPEGAFDHLTGTARPGMTPAALAASEAWRAGWQYLRAGFHWEAHELFEPVWMALPPNSRERAFVQGAIQVANAGLKARMGRPRAVARIRVLALRHLEEAGAAGAAGMGADLAELRAVLEAATAGPNLNAK